MNEAKTFKNAQDAYNALAEQIREARGMLGDLQREARAAKRLLNATVEERVHAQTQEMFNEVVKGVNAALDKMYKELSEKQQDAVRKMDKELGIRVTREIRRLADDQIKKVTNADIVIRVD